MRRTVDEPIHTHVNHMPKYEPKNLSFDKETTVR